MATTTVDGFCADCGGHLASELHRKQCKGPFQHREDDEPRRVVVVTERTPPMQQPAAEQDPIALLIESTQKVLDHLIKTRDKAEITLASRKGEIRKVEQALAVLQRGGATPKAKGSKGPTPSGFICENCGNHKASRAHKEACAA